jgi:hypothetical protein
MMVNAQPRITIAHTYTKIYRIVTMWLLCCQVSVRIEDCDVMESTMNGMPYNVGRTPHEFRMRMMRAHLGDDETIGTA